MSRRITITCDSKTAMSIESLESFQGKLKTIDDDAFQKLKASILKYGFSFPVFVWGKKILDGHQRLAAVKRLVDEGYSIDGDKLPVVTIDAENETQAAEKLLLINSRYAKMTQEGFDEFVESFDIQIDDMVDLIDIPEIDFKIEVEKIFDDSKTPDIKNDLRNGILITVGFCDILVRPDDDRFDPLYSSVGKNYEYDEDFKNKILSAILGAINE